MRSAFKSLVAAVLLTAAAAAQSADKTALDSLLERAKATHSDALVVVKDGKVATEWYSGGKPEKIELMSCTKSVVGLIVMKLVDEGKIKSLDQPVHEFYPEWKQGQKKLITIRHLMNHTSGMQNAPNTSLEIYPSPDFVRLALAAEISHAPGTNFSYNNKAVNLLAGIVQKASGRRMDQYAGEALFAPMGITDFTWTLDRAGNPHAMAGLQMTAADFVKFGQLLLDKGMFGGKRLISEKLVDESLAASQQLNDTDGLLWWRMPASTRYVIDRQRTEELRKAGVDAAALEKLKALEGSEFATMDEYTAALRKTFGENLEAGLTPFREKGMGPARRVNSAEIDGYNANGYLGQYLVVYPKYRIAAVRLIRSKESYNNATDGFNDFFEVVKKLGETSSASAAR